MMIGNTSPLAQAVEALCRINARWIQCSVVLECSAVYCSGLQSSVVYWSAVHCIAVQYSVD